jgi:hypothetical protein
LVRVMTCALIRHQTSPVALFLPGIELFICVCLFPLRNRALMVEIIIAPLLRYGVGFGTLREKLKLAK